MMQVGKLKEEWDFKTKEKKVLVDVFDVSEDKIIVG